MNDQPRNLPAEGHGRELAPIEHLKRTIASKADDFRMVLPQHITPEKFQRVVATAAIQNPQLLNCDRQSFMLAAMKLAQDGLLPDGREAALVPFKSRALVDGQWQDVWQVQPMPMVYGLRKKVLQSGEVLSIETGVVYRADVESGHFIYEIGMDPPIRYRPNLMLPLEETSDENVVAAYSIARIKNEAGGEPYWSVEVMRRAEIDKVRQSSQTGALGQKARYDDRKKGIKKGDPIAPKGPWVDWFGEMARKTVLRRHSKVLPMSGDVLETFERDIETERAADSAAAYLAAEPVSLPSAEELDQQAAGETIDQDTGEVLATDSRGMTELSEEDARELDAGTDDQAEATDEDEQDADDEAGETDGDEESPIAVKLREICGGINAAKNLKYLAAVDKEWVNARAAYDDETVAKIDGLISAKRRELQGGEGAR